MKTIFIESNNEESFDMKSQFRIKILPDPISIREPARKLYVEIKFNAPSIIKNTAHVDFNDKNLENGRFVEVISLPAVGEHLTAKYYYVDEAIPHSVNESSLSRLDPKEKLKLVEQKSLVLNSTLTAPKRLTEIPTKSYVHSLHENSRNMRDLSSVFKDQEKEFVKKKLTNLDSITMKRPKFR